MPIRQNRPRWQHGLLPRITGAREIRPFRGMERARRLAGPRDMKLNVREASRVLAVPESQIYRWVEAGEIPCYVVNHQPLFGRAELLEWATTRRLPVSTELFEDGDEEN